MSKFGNIGGLGDLPQGAQGENMAWYINLETQTISDTEPDLTGKTKVIISVPDGTTLSKVQTHLNAVEMILGNPFASIGLLVIEIDLTATWYIDLSTGTVTSSQPDMTGRVEVPFPIPNDTGLVDALAQLEALDIISGQNPLPTTALLVVKVIVGNG